MKSCVLLLALAVIAKCADATSHVAPKTTSASDTFFNVLSTRYKDAPIQASILGENNQVAFPKEVTDSGMRLYMISNESRNIIRGLNFTKPRITDALFEELDIDKAISRRSAVAEAIPKLRSLKKAGTKILKASKLIDAGKYKNLIGVVERTYIVLELILDMLGEQVEGKSKGQFDCRALHMIIGYALCFVLAVSFVAVCLKNRKPASSL